MPKVKSTKPVNQPLELQTRELSLRAETANEEAFSIEAVISSADPVRMWDWDRWEAIDEILTAEGRTVEDHIPLLNSHRAGGVEENLGHVEDVRSESDLSVATLLFDGETELGRSTFGKYKRGHLKSLSVGYVVTRHVTIDAGQTVEVEGKKYTASKERNLRVALEWKLREVSCVNIPADKKANVRQIEGVRCSQLSDSEMDWVQANEWRKPYKNTSGDVPDATKPSERSDGNFDSADKSSSHRKDSAVDPKNTQSTDVAETRQDVNVDQIRQEAITAERNRVAEIRKLGADDVRSETVEKAIQDGVTPEAFRAIALDDIRSQRADRKPVGSDAPFNIQIDSDKRNARDCNAVSLGLAVAQRMGLKNPEALAGRISFDEDTGEMTFERPEYRCADSARQEFERQLERSDKFRRAHSMDLCRTALDMQGVDSPLERKQLATRAMSTPAVSTIYTTAMGAVLLDNLGNMHDSTVGWTAERDAKSFKDQELHQLEGGKLRRRARGTKAKQAKFSDIMEVYRVSEFAETLLLDRQDLIDDELGAWLTALEEYSRSINALRPDLVYALLLTNPTMKTDSKALFHTDHKNILTSALSETSIGALLSKINVQQNSNGVNLNLIAKHVIVPSTSKFRGRQAAGSAETRGPSTEERGTLNGLKDENLIIHGEPRLDSGFTDPLNDVAVAANPNAFFAACDNGAYGMTVGFLEGSGRMPWMNTTVKNSDGVYGLSIDVAHTVGAGASNHRGLARSIGA